MPPRYILACAKFLTPHLSLPSRSFEPKTDGPSTSPKPRPSGPKKSRVNLDEKDPLYQPALDGRQLKSEPAHHRAGYVAVIGRPNAGKSTLLNALLGQKLSIVTPKAQTTRHRILAVLSEPDYQLVLLDTPGVIAKQNNKLEEM